MQLGPAGALICLSAYVVAGFIFPLGLELNWDKTLHFLVAQTLCGLISVSYPIVGASFLAMRTIYPAFLPTPELPAEEVPLLRRLDRWLTLGLILSALVPLLSVGLLATFSADFKNGMTALCAAGAAGFALLYWIVGETRADMAALLELRSSRSS